jgi:very-short-patch-repair endonuclease
MADTFDPLIAALAKRQRGYVTRRQLLDVGLGERAIKYRVKASRLIPVYAGVYAVGHVPTLPQDRACGALLACGPDAVLSHGSAATLWGVFKRWEMPFEVTATSARRRQGIRVHRAALSHRDIRVHLGVRVTSPARMLLDICPRLGDKTLTRAVNELRLERHLNLADLAEVLDRFPRNRGAKRLRPFLQPPGGPTRSEFEDAFLEFLRRYGFPQPLVNTRVAGREVDAFFPVERVIVELDGYRFHSSRERFERDRDGDAEMLAIGLATVRITWERMTRAPAREADRLMRILAARRAA